MIGMNRTMVSLAIAFTAAAFAQIGVRVALARAGAAHAVELNRAGLVAQEGGTTDPKDLPLEARLIARKNAATLDLDGKTPEQFRKLIDDAKAAGRPLPAPPVVNLVLELRNTGNTDLHVCLGKGDVGPVNGLTFDLKGPGALSASVGNARGARISPTLAKVAAGKTHTVAIGKLEFFDGRTTQACYWTQPGEYTLVVGCGLVAGGEKGFWRAAGMVVSNPIKLQVGEKKATPK